MKIWQIRSCKATNYVVVNNKLIYDENGFAKTHKAPILGTLVLKGDSIGGAVCCEEDTFSKKLGVQIATGRAKAGGKVPLKLRKHAKRMAQRYSVTMPEIMSNRPQSKD